MENITVEQIIELVRFEFRRFGFRADGGTVKESRDGKSQVIEFEPEPATGQAAFSQDRVTLDCRIWEECAEFSVGSDKPLHLELSVRYVHVGGGGNGYSVGYKIITTFGALFLVKAR